MKDRQLLVNDGFLPVNAISMRATWPGIRTSATSLVTSWRKRLYVSTTDLPHLSFCFSNAGCVAREVKLRRCVQSKIDIQGEARSSNINIMEYWQKRQQLTHEQEIFTLRKLMLV